MQTLKSLIPETLARLSQPPSKPSSAGSGWQPSLEAYEPSLVQAKAECARFVADMEAGAPPRWLTLVGDVGCGKTFLARQILGFADKAINPGRHSLWIDPSGMGHRRPRCVFLTADHFATRLRNREYDLPEYLADDFLVVFDDLGTVRDTTDFIADALFRLAQIRLRSWMVWTTNLDSERLAARVDARIVSRLIRDGNTAVKLNAGDYALRPSKSTP